jgi:hypothetical protein
MERETGYYWVKVTHGNIWQVANYINDGKWRLIGNRLYDSHTEEIFLEINEVRILNPDEQSEEDFHLKADNER